MISAPVFAFDAHQPFDISADIIDYVDANQTISAEGHVVVVQSSSTLTADSMMYDRADERMQARGNVILHEKGKIMAGDSMDYDLTNEVGSVTNALGIASAWRYKAAWWDKHADFYSGHDVVFTSCDLIDPHYHLRSSRLHLVPDRLFWAWNSRFYIDNKPVFYTPFMYKYLDHRRLVTQIQPGNDRVNGAFAKTKTTLYITPAVYDRIYFDHYSTAGNGIGNELDYSTTSIKGSLLAYYINPHTNPELSGAPNIPQYTIRSYHFQKINASTILQSNVNLRKNISFNDQFFNEDNNQAVTDISNSVALTKQNRHFSQRLVVESLDAPDPGDTSTFALTHAQTASLPRYDFTLYQIPLWSPAGTSTGTVLPATPHHWGPLLLSGNSSLGEEYARLDDQTRTKGVVDLTLTDGIALGRRWSFTPTLTPQLNWQDKQDPANQYFYGLAPGGSIVSPFNVTGSTVTASTTTIIATGLFRGFQPRIGTSDTIRYRAGSSLTFDQTYAITLRMAPNQMALDRSLADKGIETHHVSWLAFWRPSYDILFRSYSGYDLRVISNESPEAYDQRRFDPWTNEITLQPRKSSFDYFFRYQAAWYPTRVALWQGLMDYQGPYHTLFQNGLLYNAGQPGAMTLNNSVGIFLSPGWRVDAVVHSFVPDGSPGSLPSHIVDSQFIVTRDLHCWTAQFIYREILPFTQSYSLLFNLKLGPTDTKDESDHQNFESQFYPWRSNAYAR